jgi:hypothetical protein
MDVFESTVEALLSGLMIGCHWPDNKKSRIMEDDPKTPVRSLGVNVIPPPPQISRTTLRPPRVDFHNMVIENPTHNL